MKNLKILDVIVIDHHLSDTSILPKVHSIINPNRIDERIKIFFQVWQQ